MAYEATCAIERTLVSPEASNQELTKHNAKATKVVTYPKKVDIVVYKAFLYEPQIPLSETQIMPSQEPCDK